MPYWNAYLLRLVPAVDLASILAENKLTLARDFGLLWTFFENIEQLGLLWTIKEVCWYAGKVTRSISYRLERAKAKLLTIEDWLAVLDDEKHPDAGTLREGLGPFLQQYAVLFARVNALYYECQPLGTLHEITRKSTLDNFLVDSIEDFNIKGKLWCALGKKLAT